MSFGYQVLGFGGGEEIVPEFMEATGGSVTTSGDYKIHVFQADGSFDVTVGYDPTYGTEAHYLVIGGGGSSGAGHDGGGGGGGMRTSYPGDPLAAPSGLTLAKGSYPISVGAGGPGGTPGGTASKGGDSIFSTITSTGGGGSGTADPAVKDGGSGGGGTHYSHPGGSGNTPPVSPSQGFPGGNGQPNPPHGAGGGGGASAAGNPNHGTGGNGSTSSIHPGYPLGTTFSGGGGGGGGAGGDGVVMIRYKFQ